MKLRNQLLQLRSDLLGYSFDDQSFLAEIEIPLKIILFATHDSSQETVKFQTMEFPSLGIHVFQDAGEHRRPIRRPDSTALEFELLQSGALRVDEFREEVYSGVNIT